MTNNLNKEYGTQYEIYVQTYLINTNKYKNCYLWKDVPKNILMQFKFIDNENQICNDCGCDIICVTHNNEFVFVQCKNYSTTGTDNTICAKLFGMFFYLIIRHKVSYLVYYTGKLSRNLLRFGNDPNFINLPFVTNVVTNQNIRSIMNIMPRDYQIEALNKLRNIKRSILQMPCGTGKTFVSYLLSLDYDNVILLTPLISTTEQILEHYKNYYASLTDINYIEVNSSACRSILVEPNVKNIIASTYDSCNIINQSIHELSNCLVIIDEFHNLSTANLSDNNNEMYKLLVSNINILFVSATPKLLNIDNGVNISKIFGTTKYELKWQDAIDMGYICDVNVIYPEPNELNEQSQNLCVNSERFKTIIENNDKFNILKRTLFLLMSLLETKSKKCIAYFKSIEEMKNYYDMIAPMASIMNLKVDVYNIDYSITKAERKIIIDNFKKSGNIQILCNINILNEGIDIPSCDSIFVVDPAYNPVNMIQRNNRCNRKDPNNPCKVGHVFMWCENRINMEELHQKLVSLMPIKTYKRNTNLEIHNSNGIISLNIPSNILLNRNTSNNIMHEIAETKKEKTNKDTKFYCLICNYQASTSSNLIVHNKTQKHISKVNNANKNTDLNNLIIAMQKEVENKINEYAESSYILLEHKKFADELKEKYNEKEINGIFGEIFVDLIIGLKQLILIIDLIPQRIFTKIKKIKELEIHKDLETYNKYFEIYNEKLKNQNEQITIRNNKLEIKYKNLKKTYNELKFNIKINEKLKDIMDKQYVINNNKNIY